MLLSIMKRVYKPLICACFLIPNLLVIIFGIESFPYTCAPMFGHYINKDTKFYLFKLEGVKDSKSIDLTKYLGKSDDLFMRHFFSKVYGSTDAISPFTNKFSESKSDFQERMDLFFKNYSNLLMDKYKRSFDKINLKIVEVNQKREPQTKPEIIAYYDSEKQHYVSLYKNQAIDKISKDD
ncbi:hypothetical protein CJ739_3373 [Mariniflexile rhizosphaerae]|nr:hypothetical protein CJ739_3373 [Mariniflexile sp. TRM1-10]